MAGQEIHLQHTSMQFSDSVDQHLHDAKALFAHAEAHGVWACTGTEAGDTGGNHDLRTVLLQQARLHQFHMYASGYGEWVALNRRLLDLFEHGFAGPFIPGAHNHAARGVAWMSAVAKSKSGLTSTSRLTFGAAHYLAAHNQTGPTTNEPLTKGIGEWGQEAGKGHNVVFLGADVNTDDKAKDVFMGQPFRTVADELGKWPATHGRRPIDVIASYNADKRVKAKSYRVLTDSDMYLASDHLALEAVFELSVAGQSQKEV